MMGVIWLSTNELDVQQFIQKGTKRGPATLLRPSYTTSATVAMHHKAQSPAAAGVTVLATLEALTQMEV